MRKKFHWFPHSPKVVVSISFKYHQILCVLGQNLNFSKENRRQCEHCCECEVLDHIDHGSEFRLGDG